jgi:hypothetical protein
MSKWTEKLELRKSPEAEMPIQVHIEYTERGTDEDGKEVQRIEGFGARDWAHLMRKLGPLCKDGGDGHVERFTVEFKKT